MTMRGSEVSVKLARSMMGWAAIETGAR